VPCRRNALSVDSLETVGRLSDLGANLSLFAETMFSFMSCHSCVKDKRREHLKMYNCRNYSNNQKSFTTAELSMYV